MLRKVLKKFDVAFDLGRKPSLPDRLNFSRIQGVYGSGKP